MGVNTIYTVIGGTGLIGRALVKELKKRGTVNIITRYPENYESTDPEIKYFKRCRLDARELCDLMESSTAVINLAGENIASRKWNRWQKQKILLSRSQTGHWLAEAIKKCQNPPKVLIQASAIGYYGDRGFEEISEESQPGNGALAYITRIWEDSVQDIKKITRVVYLRTGIVFSEKGSLQKMAKAFKMGLGGKLGSGNQYMSWIHIEDEVKAILYLIDNPSSSGVYNLTAPEPVQQKTLAKSLSAIFKKPARFHAPAWLLRLLLGEMAEEILLSGQKVIPARLTQEGFHFSYPTLNEALNQIFNKK